MGWVLALLLFATSARAELLRVGVKAGVPLTETITSGTEIGIRGSFTTYRSQTRRYVVGATAQMMLPAGLRASVDALYRRYSYEAVFAPGGLPIAGSTRRATGYTLDVPIELKYFPCTGGVRPFVGVGWALKHQGRSELQDARWRDGSAFSGGLEVGRGRVRFGPEVRLSVWSLNAPRPGDVGARQVDVLLGLTF